jgi:enamidase
MANTAQWQTEDKILARRFFMRVIVYLFIVVLLATGGFVYYVATLYTASAAQKGYLALTGATVLIGEELEPRPNATVLIQDGIILEVGNADEVEIPPGATILDLRSYTLLPGLMDLHVHLGAPALEAGQEPGLLQSAGQLLDSIRLAPSKRRAYLSHGITTIRSLGDDYEWILELRRGLRAGELEGPRLFIAGPLFTTPGGHPVVTLGVDPHSDGVRLPSTADEARRMVRELVAGDEPVDLIKVVQERGRAQTPLQPIATDVLDAIVDEAHSFGLPVFAHWGTQEDLSDVLNAGVDGLEHTEPRGTMQGWAQGILDTLVERDVSLSPTLAVLEAATRRPRSQLPPDIMQEPQQRVREFHAAGGRVVAGSDAGMPGVPFGPGLHRELELLVESGLTPQEALKAATSHAAIALQSDHIGAIAPGRAADLLVVKGDPLLEIQAARNVVMVFRDGRLVVDPRNEQMKK